MFKRIIEFLCRDKIFLLEDDLGFYKRMYKLQEIYNNKWRESLEEALENKIITLEQFSDIYSIKARKMIELDKMLIEKGLEGVD